MIGRIRQAATLTGAAALVAMAFAVPAASAAGKAKAHSVPGSLPFSQATFNGYSSGTELHLYAANLGSTGLADTEQAFTGASTNTAGLTSAIASDTGQTFQTPQAASTKAFGFGDGLEVGLAAGNGGPNQLNLADHVTAIAPPNGPVKTAQIGPINVPPLVSASLLSGRAGAIYDTTTCPIGQPLSFGRGDAANVNLLNAGGTIGPIVNTAGSGTPPANTTANSTSFTYLSPNPDGTFGLTTEVREVIAPATVNLFGAAQLKITVQGTSPNDPVVFKAVTTGEGSGASVSVSTDALVHVTITSGTTTTDIVPPTSVNTILHNNPPGLHLVLDPSILASQLAAGLGNIPGLGAPLATILTALNALPVGTLVKVNLGTLDIGTPIRAIGGSATSLPTVIGGTDASGAEDIVKLDLGFKGPITILGQPLPLPSIPALNDIAHFNLGHLEAKAHLTSAINCSLPIIKSANPPNVQAGNNFVYTIQVPDPAKIPLISCDLTNISVSDVISDLQGTPTFSVVSASNGGQVTTNPDGTVTVNWAGLNYKVAVPPAQPNPPITLTITVAVPANSPAGVIQDLVQANGTAANCNGGGSGIAGIGNGAVLNGTFTLQAPSVSGNPNGPPPGPGPGNLPHTGGTGGLWQPLAGVAALGLAGGTFALLRRSRRRNLGL